MGERLDCAASSLLFWRMRRGCVGTHFAMLSCDEVMRTSGSPYPSRLSELDGMSLQISAKGAMRVS